MESKSLTSRSRQYDGGEENAEMLVKSLNIQVLVLEMDNLINRQHGDYD